jgi:hydroxylysine kinase
MSGMSGICGVSATGHTAMAMPPVTAFDQLPEAAVLCAPAAPVAEDWAARQLATHWGLAGRLQVLSGERDANFLLHCDGAPASAPLRVMLKVSHPVEPPLVADFQTQALLHIARVAPTLPVQRLLPTWDGQTSLLLAAPDGPPRVLRLFSYLDGLPMPQAPRSRAQQLNLARQLARLDQALAGLQHPAGALELPWDIQRVERVRSLLTPLADASRRTLALQALDDVAQQVAPLLPTLRRQPVHNDFNLHNLLVDPADTDRVCGILDFGDMVVAPMVNDLAVAASYQLATQADDATMLAQLVDFVAAYHALTPLTATELGLLPLLMRARLAMVVAISGWRAQRQPHNADYLLRNNTISWARLQACARIGTARLQDALRQACDSAGPNPTAP